MCATVAAMTALELFTAAGTAIGAATSIHGAMQAGKGPKAPEPIKPPEAAKAPDADVFRTRNAAMGGGPGKANSTLLSGLGGVPASAINLGKNTLLGQA